MLDHDQAARQRAVTLEATGKLPPGLVAQHYPLTRAEQVELKRLKNAAAAAAGDPDVYVALARGRTVDESRIEPKMRAHWRRYGTS